jgi:hypothetical protein
MTPSPLAIHGHAGFRKVLYKIAKRSMVSQNLFHEMAKLVSVVVYAQYLTLKSFFKDLSHSYLTLNYAMCVISYIRLSHAR